LLPHFLLKNVTLPNRKKLKRTGVTTATIEENQLIFCGTIFWLQGQNALKGTCNQNSFEPKYKGDAMVHINCSATKFGKIWWIIRNNGEICLEM
jgi:hypothetical protein